MEGGYVYPGLGKKAKSKKVAQNAEILLRCISTKAIPEYCLWIH